MSFYSKYENNSLLQENDLKSHVRDTSKMLWIFSMGM